MSANILSPAPAAVAATESEIRSHAATEAVDVRSHSATIDDSIDDSLSSTGTTGGSQPENNNVLKQPALLLSQSAEIYYKQLLAANVAVLGGKGSAEDRRANLLYAKNAFEEKAALVWGEGGAQHGGATGGSAGVKSGGPGGQGGGGQGQGGAGLVHWMSVMAEHMNTVSGTAPHHHDAAAVHYMWNGAVDQCGAHGKDVEYSWTRQSMAKQEYESKMNSVDQQNSQGLHKEEGSDRWFGRHFWKGPWKPSYSTGGVDDGRMEGVVPGGGGIGAVYGGGRSHSSSSSSASPPHGQAMLVVPHPLTNTKDQHHVVTQNGSGRKYQCKMCPLGRGRKSGLNRTRDGLGWTGVDHGNPEIFGSKSELQMHSQLHMREVKPYKCTQCSKTFANSSYLSQHTRIHLGIKPYRCEICQRKFTQLSHLQQHIRTHTGDKPYKCRHPNCNKAFSQLSNLQSHSRCHQTDKPYKCNSCYKCFSDEPSLLEHIPKHKESKHLKTHICQYCGKSYTQETYLSKHMQKHAERTDKRPPIIGIPRVTLDNPHYWPKVSPDTANNLVDAFSQHEALQQQNNGVLGNNDHLHRDMNGGGNGGDDPHSGRPPAPPPTPGAVSPGNYHDSVIGKNNTSSASAFTPIQSMGIPSHHHNHHLNHHQISDPRSAYLPYNAIAFPGTKVVTSAGQIQGLPGSVQTSVAMEMPKTVSGNSFPNLISLNQIRNYAHQPTPSLMSTEHLIEGLKNKSQ
ncbi:zinc finger protein rotund isoform X3 [Nilaparvata lugens]|uniref:zinc finger protein rotund isoform X3 n=1 Tax=Nilaparvata lugens TaxID=108931 RepID=UPI00193DE1E7|nr:zinc finger protein rotund isoform X3 [Nilaparvata lugens]